MFKRPTALMDEQRAIMNEQRALMDEQMCKIYLLYLGWELQPLRAMEVAQVVDRALNNFATHTCQLNNIYITHERYIIYLGRALGIPGEIFGTARVLTRAGERG